ncbi:MAG: DNA translocase FtsK, partial [Paludibacteraceae bacterium]|nr:DNA translocase FtsK [Paludibacteraceae bacterium]
MATEKGKKTSKTTNKASFGQSLKNFLTDRRTHIAFGIIACVCVLYLAISMISYFFTGAEDNSIVTENGIFSLTSEDKISNWGGRLGAYASEWLVNDCFGIASFFLLGMVALVGLRLIGVRFESFWKTQIMLLCGLIWTSFSISFFFYGFYKDFINFGGNYGYEMSETMANNVGKPGTFLIILAFLILFIVFFHQETIPYLVRLLERFWTWLKDLFGHKVKDELLEGEDDRIDQVAASDEVKDGKEDDNSNVVAPVVNVTENEGEDEGESEDDNSWTITEGPISVHSEPVDEQHTPVAPVQTPTPAPANLPDVDFSVTAGGNEGEGAPVSAPATTDDDSDDDAMLSLEELGEYDPTLDLSHYKYPELSLLKDYGNERPAINLEEQNANKKRITTTLSNYGIEITSISATVGPTITLYEIVPKPGVRISKIRSLESDIMLSLAATGIRIIAPIPGKGTIGIEVPNENKQIVSMMSMMSSKKYQEAKEKYALPIALGETITNEVFVFDLAKAPHMLVAGATGQGKSVALNAIITSLLYAKHPAYMKFVMVDPKKVEFTLYSKIERQFLAKVPDEEEPIITDVTKVVQTLNSLTKEMDDRYTLLKKAQVRNITEYNDKFIHRKLNPEKGHRFLPYIVVVIDEFGDLIMVAGKEVELPIARIAQLARAVGIHMIIATQRPSVNVITGIIKANFPTRVACRVTSVVDSRTVLDASGAQQLIGRGDLLFSKDGETTRVQCAFVDTPEVENIVDYIGEQQGYPTAMILPDYDPNAGTGSYDGGLGGGSSAPSSDIDPNERDPLFEEIAKMVVASQQGSTSNIQRKFKIG